MEGQKDGWMEGQTDPILQDPFGYRRGSNKGHQLIFEVSTTTTDFVSES